MTTAMNVAMSCDAWPWDINVECFVRLAEFDVSDGALIAAKLFGQGCSAEPGFQQYPQNLIFV